MKKIDIVNLESVYMQIPGGPELLEWFEKVPSFHDAEIVSLALHRRSPSILTIHGWTGDGTVTQQGFFKQLKKAVVTLEIHEIVYLKLGGFSRQNVIYGMNIVQSPPDPEAKPYYSTDSDENDYEIHLEPCYGLDGLIRCKKISVSFKPGDPIDSKK